ncbi:hypothetical protein CSUI_009693 [Cystoisospora suis]|uniref:Uncharacterized protein n=1 Tax=Cystoisospora suis TaxID=483139 RepID=A0A2C6JFW0_9APIC|nr:hypothetical protein CSUI_009693 [Cystoisospora suis]
MKIHISILSSDPKVTHGAPSSPSSFSFDARVLELGKIRTKERQKRSEKRRETKKRRRREKKSARLLLV